MNSIVAESIVHEVVTRNVPTAVDRVYELCEKVLVYSETEKERFGPFEVFQVQEVIRTVQNNDKSVRKTFNACQVEMYYGEAHVFKFSMTLATM